MKKRVAALTIEQCRAIIINLAHRLDVLEIVIAKMLREAGISWRQLRPGCELLMRFTAAKDFKPQGVPVPDLGMFCLDITPVNCDIY